MILAHPRARIPPRSPPPLARGKKNQQKPSRGATVPRLTEEQSTATFTGNRHTCRKAQALAAKLPSRDGVRGRSLRRDVTGDWKSGTDCRPDPCPRTSPA